MKAASLFRKTSDVKKNLLCISLIIVFGLYASHSWIGTEGYPHTHDGGWNIQYYIAMDDNLQYGNFPAYWNPNTSDGSGEALYFVGPFTFYLIEIIHIFQPDFFQSITLLIPVIYIGSGLTLFLLMKKIRPRW